MLTEENRVRVKNVIHGFTGEALEDIHDTSRLGEDLDLDDLDIFELAMELEEEFEIDIDDAKFESLSTVEAVYKFIGDEIA